ncbi:16S rRNA (guanine(527)-N(7))-methyltransferase RsmG [bacterium]|nr:16S rRNA (guanine(527)-N(7))-methyltransferase RsmG [candidate division CSSED10-310 bacterium]
MSDIFTSQEISLLTDSFLALSIHVEDRVIHRLQSFFSILEKWNRSYNLTRIPREEWLLKIILQSAAAGAIAVRSSNHGLWADMGTGAGIPGMILAILHPDQDIHLIDSRSKKTDFLTHVSKALLLENAKIYKCRIEVLLKFQPDLVEKFSAIFARALTDARVIMDWAWEFLMPDGLLILPGTGFDTENRIISLDKKRNYIVLRKMIHVPSQELCERCLALQKKIWEWSDG